MRPARGLLVLVALAAACNGDRPLEAVTWGDAGGGGPREGDIEGGAGDAAPGSDARDAGPSGQDRAASMDRSVDRATGPVVKIVDPPPPSPNKLTCGDALCDPAAQVCCLRSPDGVSIGESCDSNGSACADGVPKTCDGKEDCTGGDFCCFKAAEISCTPLTSCHSPGYFFCHTTSDCPADVPYCCGIATNGTVFPLCSAYPCPGK